MITGVTLKISLGLSYRRERARRGFGPRVDGQFDGWWVLSAKQSVGERVSPTIPSSKESAASRVPSVGEITQTGSAEGVWHPLCSVYGTHCVSAIDVTTA